MRTIGGLFLSVLNVPSVESLSIIGSAKDRVLPVPVPGCQ